MANRTELGGTTLHYLSVRQTMVSVHRPVRLKILLTWSITWQTDRCTPRTMASEALPHLSGALPRPQDPPLPPLLLQGVRPTSGPPSRDQQPLCVSSLYVLIVQKKSCQNEPSPKHSYVYCNYMYVGGHIDNLHMLN